jgi:hypothetical protein
MTVTIDLLKQIYPHNCVESACEAFSDLADIKLVPKSKGSVSVWISASESEARIMNEFLNYVLILSIEQFLKDKIASA